jgi:hypothetical protein
VVASSSPDCVRRFISERTAVDADVLRDVNADLTSL